MHAMFALLSAFICAAPCVWNHPAYPMNQELIFCQKLNRHSHDCLHSILGLEGNTVFSKTCTIIQKFCTAPQKCTGKLEKWWEMSQAIRRGGVLPLPLKAEPQHGLCEPRDVWLWIPLLSRPRTKVMGFIWFEVFYLLCFALIAHPDAIPITSSGNGIDAAKHFMPPNAFLFLISVYAWHRPWPLSGPTAFHQR